MILTEIKKVVTKTFVIDYENGITCRYTTNNGKLDHYTFSTNKMTLNYVPSEKVPLLRTSHWSKHHELIETFKSVIKLKEFTEFDNLFYVGSHRDGMLRNKDGEYLSTPIRMDDAFCSIYLRIETKKEKCQAILDSLNKEYILASNYIELPYYNRRENKKHHYTLDLTVLVPDDIYRRFLGDKSHLDDACKVEIFNFLKKESQTC